MELNNATNIVQIISSTVLAVFTVALWFATNAQKNIAKKQYNTEIYKLRLEHLNKLVLSWTRYNKYFVKTDDKIRVLSSGITHADQYREFFEILEQLESLQISAKYIYSNSIADKEKELTQDIEKVHELYKGTIDNDILNELYSQSEQKYKDILEYIDNEIEEDNAK